MNRNAVPKPAKRIIGYIGINNTRKIATGETVNRSALPRFVLGHHIF